MNTANAPLCRSPWRHCRKIGRQVGRFDLAVGTAVFVDVHAAPGARLHEHPDIVVSRHAAIGFATLTIDRPASGVGALLNDRRRADREAALVEDLLVAVAVDLIPAPRA